MQQLFYRRGCVLLSAVHQLSSSFGTWEGQTKMTAVNMQLWIAQQAGGTQDHRYSRNSGNNTGQHHALWPFCFTLHSSILGIICIWFQCSTDEPSDWWTQHISHMTQWCQPFISTNHFCFEENHHHWACFLVYCHRIYITQHEYKNQGSYFPHIL